MLIKKLTIFFIHTARKRVSKRITRMVRRKPAAVSSTPTTRVINLHSHVYQSEAVNFPPSDIQSDLDRTQISENQLSDFSL